MLSNCFIGHWIISMYIMYNWLHLKAKKKSAITTGPNNIQCQNMTTVNISFNFKTLAANCLIIVCLLFLQNSGLLPRTAVSFMFSQRNNATFWIRTIRLTEVWFPIWKHLLILEIDLNTDTISCVSHTKIYHFWHEYINWSFILCCNS